MTNTEFRARLVKLSGQKAALKDGETTHRLVEELSGERFAVAAVEKRERRRNPPPPFTTAKLQQEADNRLGFTAKKTRTLAQRLYEGVELGDEGAVGLITYMRTDSVRLSAEAVDGVRRHIADYGGDPDFVAVKGGSAGGHLAALVALTANDPRLQPGFEEVDTHVAAAVPF